MAGRIDRDAMKRDADADVDGCGSDDDSEWLDDPVAVGLQPLNQAAGLKQLPNIPRPDHVSPETHDLIVKTMRGSDSWRESKEKDDALVALRLKRMAELRMRASGGGPDGLAAALVAAELEDLDGERLTRHLSTMDPGDALVVHVHAPSAKGSAVLDAAIATLASRHSRARRGTHASLGSTTARSTSSPLDGHKSVVGGGADFRSLAGGGSLAFARLSAVDAGVTARLDVVDKNALPAILVYRGGKLAASRVSVMLPRSSCVQAGEAVAEEPAAVLGLCDQSVQGGLDPRSGGYRQAESLASETGRDATTCRQATLDRVLPSDDLEALADDVEDLLDDLGLYD